MGERRRSKVEAREYREWKERRERVRGWWEVSKAKGGGDRDRGGVVGWDGMGWDGMGGNGVRSQERGGGIILFFAPLQKSGASVLAF